ncbi:MAG: hypothetical protein KDE55_05765 [Novosphingobium sp.]|nr:hypothetical protein [Novosphingobium sp.]
MRACLLPVLLLVSACSSERKFDERFDDAEKSIRDKAAAIDKELAEKAVNDDPEPAGTSPAGE